MARQCAAKCGKSIPAGAHGGTRYCSKACKDRQNKRDYRARKRVDKIDPKRIRKGSVYETLENAPELVEAIKNKEVTQRDAAAAIGVGESMFSEAWANYLSHEQLSLEQLDWTRDPLIDRMLAVGEWDWDGDPDTLEEWLDRAVEGFVQWRARYHRTARGPYYTKDFHKVWIRGTLKALVTGGRYCILSPPRHGKSELMVHFSEWLIARNPNIRIAWIGGNADIAGDMVAEVRRGLESNEEMIADVLGPAGSWRPSARTNGVWGAKKFIVANRDPQISNKSPTMVAIGRSGKILSRDIDLMVTDDIEDLESTDSETTRGKTRHWWFNSAESRKEEHTAWMTIGSRQHPDDIYAYLLEDDEWETTVDAAHDPMCMKDPDKTELHIDCMLFPELRSYRWLRGKQRTADAQGLGANFEMVYLNDPRPAGLMVFDEDEIRAKLNPNRRLGLGGLDPEQGYHLVGGLDPSATGFQAAFLWAWVKGENKLYVIDIDNRKGGGVYEAWALFREWLEAYDLRHWVIEENGFQKAIRENREIQDWALANGVYLEGHETQGNKNDPLYGVGAMSGLFDPDQDLIDIPWLGERTREKVGLWIRQMVRFVDAAGAMRRLTRKTDVLMASWFPMKAIRRFRKEVQAEASRGDEFSFTGFDQTEWNEVPW